MNVQALLSNSVWNYYNLALCQIAAECLRKYASANTLVILYMVTGFCWLGGVSFHDIVVHEGSTSEETKATRATEHAAKHMFCCLLQPMAHCILELLIPHHGPFKHNFNRDEGQLDY